MKDYKITISRTACLKKKKKLGHLSLLSLWLISLPFIALFFGGLDYDFAFVCNMTAFNLH